ncbi:glycosyltransferase [Psychroserpens sp. XS_ASV72]|uniref:glycosyltransferase n=1 Tax=Psychroserpens sp. XS_ASV72 TaxID=3241293 RepID=UPI0035170C14
MSTLTIISHTEHYKSSDGTLVGLGSTITEINHLLEIFDQIIHVGMFHEEEAPPSALPYISDRITFVALPALGGHGFIDKVKILWNTPRVLKIVRNSINQADYFQFRAPTGIGVFVLPYLTLFSSKKGWFKYAGNWKQKKAPLAYQFQRWWLKKQKRPVTINGKWEDTPEHCLAFENPCLTEKEFIEGETCIENKQWNASEISLCFVGRLEDQKGIGLLIEVLSRLDQNEKTKLKDIHIVGDGANVGTYKQAASASGLNFVFHGVLSRKEVHRVYKISHAIVLPSASEGFPKVISEAMNYGCIPVVSNVSSISNYVKDNINGFLFYPITFENLADKIKKILNLTDLQYYNIIKSQNQELIKFTYSYYNKRIKEEILR